MPLDVFEAVALSGAGEEFAATALQAALALGRASTGAVYLVQGEALEVLASNLDPEARKRAEALLGASDPQVRTGCGPAGAFILVPFTRGDSVLGALYLEGVESPGASPTSRTTRVAQVLASYFAHRP